MKRKGILTRTAAVMLCVLMCLVISGCGKGNMVESAYLNLDLEDYISMPDNYLDFEYDDPVVEITDEMVETEIKLSLESATVDTLNNEGEVKTGDKVYITYVAKNLQGEEVASNKGYAITIGKDYLTDDFEKALIGHKVGDVVKFSYTIADDFEYDESLQGQDVIYEISIEKKYDVKDAELNDEWVQANSSCKTVDEYKAFVKKDLYNTYYENALDDLFTGKFNEVLEATEVLQDYPQELIDAEIDYFQGYAYYYGYQNYGLDLDSLGDDYAQDAIKSKMVMYLIAEKEDLIPTKDQFAEYCTRLITEQGYTEATFMDTFVYGSYDYGLKFGWLEEYLNTEVERLVLGFNKDK